MPFLPGGTDIGKENAALPVKRSFWKDCRTEVLNPAPLPPWPPGADEELAALSEAGFNFACEFWGSFFWEALAAGFCPDAEAALTGFWDAEAEAAGCWAKLRSCKDMVRIWVKIKSKAIILKPAFFIFNLPAIQLF
jgi:hypothetical protein